MKTRRSSDTPVGVFSTSVNGSGSTENLLADGRLRSHSLSPDGEVLALMGRSRDAESSDVWLLPLDGESSPRKFISTEFDEHSPMFSPDGRSIAYVSNESGRMEVYVQSYPDGGRRWTISTGGGEGPVWARDGNELYYARDGQMWAVPVQTEPEFVPGTPQLLFEGSYDLADGHPHYDVAPDGRFLVRKMTSGPLHFGVVLNWSEALRPSASTQ